MIRAWAMLRGRQSQSMLMVLPLLGMRSTFAVPTTVFSPTQHAWRSLSDKSQQWHDSRLGDLSHPRLKWF
jgi:hypothetical protein